MNRSTRSPLARGVAALLLLGAAAGPAGAVDLWGAFGYDFVPVSSDERVHGAMLLGGASSRGFEFMAGGLWFEGAASGALHGALLGVGAPLRRALVLRATALRLEGEGGDRSRLKSGVVWNAPGGGSLGLHGAREDGVAGRLDLLTLEGGMPLAVTVLGRLAAGWAFAERAEGGPLASAGATWMAHRRLALGGDLGVAATATEIASASSSGGSLPLIGGRRQDRSATERTLGLTATLSVRVPL